MDNLSRILIVDDEKQNIRILTDFLREDFKIMAAKDGETALNALRKSDKLPDLILLDIMMPNMDGFEVIKALKTDERTRSIPVIFITALDATTDESKGFEQGAVDYITKPFKPVIVKARVKTHIQLKRKTDLLDRLASLDGLTQIPNRRNFDLIFEKELRKASRNHSCLSLVLLDIDYFKSFNDNYGHTAGDDCIKEVAGALEAVVSRPGDFVARYGGEEFAIILPETDITGALHMAEKARQSVARLMIPHAFSDVSDYISISAGVGATTPGKEIRAIELIGKADAALYQAKADGRDRVTAARN